MIHLDDTRLTEYLKRQNLKSVDGSWDRQQHAKEVNHLMTFENDAVELQLSNLINTYGVGKVKKILNELTKLKKAV